MQPVNSILKQPNAPVSKTRRLRDAIVKTVFRRAKKASKQVRFDLTVYTDEDFFAAKSARSVSFSERKRPLSQMAAIEPPQPSAKNRNVKS